MRNGILKMVGFSVLVAVIILMVLLLGVSLFAKDGKDFPVNSLSYVQITLQNGKVVSGLPDSLEWFDDSGMLLVELDGRTYYVHSSNFDLTNIAKKN